MDRPKLFTRTARKQDISPLGWVQLGICFFLILLMTLVVISGKLERFENLIFDTFQKIKSSSQVHPAVVVVDIDKESLDQIGRWPWPWRYHAELIDFMTESGAAAVVFDFPFEASRAPLEGNQFEKSLENATDIYLPTSLETRKEKKFWVHSLPIALEPEGERKYWRHSSKVLELKSKGVGHTNTKLDSDGVLRRVRPAITYAEQTHLHLGLRVAYDYLEKVGIGPSTTALRLDTEGNLAIRWLGGWKQVFEHYAYADIIRTAQALQKKERPVVDPKNFQAKIVLVGLTDPSLANTFVTPVGANYPRVGVLAHIMEMVLAQRFIKPIPWTIHAFCLMVLGIFVTFLFYVLRNVPAFIAAIGISIVWLILSFTLFAVKGILFFVVQPLLLILVLYIFSAIFSQVILTKEKSKLLDLATKDGLTGLYVIRHFREIMNQVLLQAHETGENISIILTDIDNFKKINDTYGHQAGDMVLKKCAEVIQNFFRSNRPVEESDFVGRYGGEEFIVLLRNAHVKDVASKMAERIRKAIEETEFVWDDKPIKVTLSLGVSMRRSDEKLPDAMVRRADESLYKAKRTGKNRVCLEDE